MSIKKVNLGDNLNQEYFFSYNGQVALQKWGVMDAFTKLGEIKSFGLIIELGSFQGGLTNALADNIISKNAYIHTFDIDNSKFKNYHTNKIVFNNLNIYNNWDVIKNLVSTLELKSSVLYLCDGGNKKLEYKYISENLMIPGDCIMVHDYFPDEQAYCSGRWNWWEFEDSDYVENHRLKKTVNYFDDYVWFFREYV